MLAVYRARAEGNETGLKAAIFSFFCVFGRQGRGEAPQLRRGGRAEVQEVVVVVFGRLVLRVLPLVLRPATGVHEEVPDGAEFKSELLGDGDLHLLGGSLRLLKNGLQGAPLEVGKDQAGFLGGVGVLLLLLLLFFFPFAGCKGEKKEA